MQYVIQNTPNTWKQLLTFVKFPDFSEFHIFKDFKFILISVVRWCSWPAFGGPKILVYIYIYSIYLYIFEWIRLPIRIKSCIRTDSNQSCIRIARASIAHICSKSERTSFARAAMYRVIYSNALLLRTPPAANFD